MTPPPQMPAFLSDEHRPLVPQMSQSQHVSLLSAPSDGFCVTQMEKARVPALPCAQGPRAGPAVWPLRPQHPPHCLASLQPRWPPCCFQNMPGTPAFAALPSARCALFQLLSFVASSLTSFRFTLKCLSLQKASLAAA